jgi:hypothetical protein
MDGRLKKHRALAGIVIVSIFVPFCEVFFTGGSEPFGIFALAQNALLIAFVYYWYHADKSERNYSAGPLMNAGVLAFFPLGLPIYLIRSRGWSGAVGSIALGVGVLIAIGVLGAIGAALGALLGS